ncbi:hypothetical protein [Nocardia harenae]|nr:hypothetical protein [Nocardia harenae]
MLRPAPGSFGTAQYDPHTGNYLGLDGKQYQQMDLAGTAAV